MYKGPSAKQKSYPMYLKVLCQVHNTVLCRGGFGLLVISLFLHCPIYPPLYIYDLSRAVLSHHLPRLSNTGLFMI